MFLTDDEFRESLAITLKIDVGRLGKHWDLLCQEAHKSAYFDVRGALLARGYAASEVDNWDRGPEFERDIGLFWALLRGSRFHNYGTDVVDKLDRREELKSVMVENLGTVQIPSGTPPRIDGGLLDTTNDEWTVDTPL